MDDMTAISSWSGGKDGCLACYRAMKSGYDIKYLLNFISAIDGERCCFHGIRGDVIKLQAELIGIPLIQKKVSSDMQDYEVKFKEAVLKLKAGGVDKIVFGDIYIPDQVNWVDRVCKDVGMTPIEPLWHAPPSEIIEEFINLGFKTIIVSCKIDKLGKEFIGKCIDKEMVEEFKRRGVCPCGENGEFHTLVVDGPMFKRGIEILESEPILKRGFWEHWFLDIKKYR